MGAGWGGGGQWIGLLPVSGRIRSPCITVQCCLLPPRLNGMFPWLFHMMSRVAERLFTLSFPRCLLCV